MGGVSPLIVFIDACMFIVFSGVIAFCMVKVREAGQIASEAMRLAREAIDELGRK